MVSTTRSSNGLGFDGLPTWTWEKKFTKDRKCFIDGTGKEYTVTLQKNDNYKKVRFLKSPDNKEYCLLSAGKRDPFSNARYTSDKKQRTEKALFHEMRVWDKIYTNRPAQECYAKVHAFVMYAGNKNKLSILMPRYAGDISRGLDCSIESVPLSSREEILSYVKQILESLVALKEDNILHKDIKLENYLTETTKEGTRLKLADFAFAVLNAHQKEQQRAIEKIKGTTYTIAPELLFGPSVLPLVPEKIDIYSAAAVILRFLDDPDSKQAIETAFHKLKKISEMDFIPYAQVYHAYDKCAKKLKQSADPLSQLVGKMLARDPNDRPTAEEALTEFTTKTLQAEPGKRSCSQEEEEDALQEVDL